MTKPPNTGFYSVFKQKLDQMKDQLRKELERAKSDRRKDWIKSQIRECKRLQKTVNQMEGVMDLPKTSCPHCGEKL
jgi:ArsR family metal-binding transcriptional regulator